MTVIRYDQVYTDAATSHIREVSEGELYREPIDPLNIGYTDWIAAGNTPAKVAGNKYVTIAEDGTVTYDSTTAAADAAAAEAEAAKPTIEERLAAAEDMIAYLTGGS